MFSEGRKPVNVNNAYSHYIKAVTSALTDDVTFEVPGTTYTVRPRRARIRRARNSHLHD